MSMYELEVGWAVTANTRRSLRWELLTCERVLGVFGTPRANVLAVLFQGEPREFHDWASTLARQSSADSPNPQTHQKGASQ
jgi:hypothetical protein